MERGREGGERKRKRKRRKKCRGQEEARRLRGKNSYKGGGRGKMLRKEKEEKLERGVGRKR